MKNWRAGNAAAPAARSVRIQLPGARERVLQDLWRVRVVAIFHEETASTAKQFHCHLVEPEQ